MTYIPGYQSVPVANEVFQTQVLTGPVSTSALPGDQPALGIQDQNFGKLAVRNGDAVAEECSSTDPAEGKSVLRSHHHDWFRGDAKRLVAGPRGEEVSGWCTTRGVQIRLIAPATRKRCQAESGKERSRQPSEEQERHGHPMLPFNEFTELFLVRESDMRPRPIEECRGRGDPQNVPEPHILLQPLFRRFAAEAALVRR